MKIPWVCHEVGGPPTLVSFVGSALICHFDEVFYAVLAGLFGLAAINIFLHTVGRVPLTGRNFHHLALLVYGFASVSYLALACLCPRLISEDTDLLAFVVNIAKWLTVTPVVLIMLCLMVDLSASNTAAIAGCDVLVFISLLLAELTDGPSRWVCFVVAFAFLLPVLFFLLEEFDREKTYRFLGAYAVKLYPILVWSTCAILVCNLVVWAVGSGTGLIPRGVQSALYALLDLGLLFGVVPPLLVFGPRRLLGGASPRIPHVSNSVRSGSMSDGAKGRETFPLARSASSSSAYGSTYVQV